MSQCPDGEIGNGVPGTCGADKDPSWSTVYPTVAWSLLRYHNATATIAPHYATIKQYMAWVMSNVAASGLKNIFSYWGDWNPAYPQPRNGTSYTGPAFTRTISHITAAASVLHDHLHLVDLATALGHAEDASSFAQTAAQLRQEFHTAFYDPVRGMYGDGTLTAQAVALWLDVPPTPEIRSRVADGLVATIVNDNGLGMATVGFIGVRYLFEALSAVNRTDIAIQMLLHTGYPSFGYEMTNRYEPATALWESFDGDTMHQWVDESSRDHHYEASINTFLRKKLAGLDMPGGVFAFATVLVRPEAAMLPSSMASTLLSANVTLATRRGRVAVAWQVLGGRRPASSPPPPPTPPPRGNQCMSVPQTPVPAGGLCGAFRNVNLTCAAGEVITGVDYAIWGQPPLARNQSWSCFGPQPPAIPAQWHCAANVSSQVAAACLTRSACSFVATTDLFGNPCKLPAAQANACPPGGYQLAARVTCAASPAPALQERAAAEARAAGVRAAAAAAALAPAFELKVTVPAGSTGIVHVPLFDSVGTAEVQEGGVTVWRNGAFVPGAAPGVLSGAVDSSGRFAAFGTVAGDYAFVVSV